MRDEPADGWIARTFREAAWAPLLVLGPVLLADWSFAVYTRYPWIDMPTHFLGGIATTHFFWRASVNSQSVADPGAKASHAVPALAGTITLALLWELFEFLADRLLGAHMQHGLLDTWSDIFLGLAGAVVYLALRRWFALPDSAPAAPDSSDDRAY
jgi:hypothetical protein